VFTLVPGRVLIAGSAVLAAIVVLVIARRR
jgi:hypothetical protein